MTTSPGRPAPLPDPDTWRSWGIDPRWSRVVEVDHDGGAVHRWHLLDTGTPAGRDDAAVVVCVHGNPTWAYAWKTFLLGLGSTHRVIAVDQLGMGFSERTGPRHYAQRVADLARLIDTLDLPDRIVLAAHDWGGAIAMGWAVDHPMRVEAMVLCNTGIAVPRGRSAPGIIRLAASAPLRDLVCHRTPTFVEGTVRLSRGRLDAVDRQAFRAPYRRRGQRRAIADFVADIPLRSPHRSEAALASVADRLGEVGAPVLLAWGAADPVFDDDFAADLAERLPNTTLHRFPHANHLVMAEADVAGLAGEWLADLRRPRVPPPPSDPVAEDPGRRTLWSAIAARRSDDTVAFHDVATGESCTFAELARRVDAVAAGLVRQGVEPGDHVAMVTPCTACGVRVP